MNSPQIYISISIVVLATVAVLLFFANKNQKDKKLTPLAGFAFGFILAGVFFGDERLIGYSLFGVGIIIAVVDIFRKQMAK